MMTSAQVVEMSVNVITNSPSQEYTHPDDHNLPTYEMSEISINSVVTVLSVLFSQTSIVSLRYA